jgi:DNA-binding Lrp family transcriptional regulator
MSKTRPTTQVRSPDEVDLKIISCLKENPRQTNKAIAHKTGVSESTVAYRIRDMSSDQVMRVVAQRDIYREGYDVLCFLFLHVSGRSRWKVADQLAKSDSVIGLSIAIGSPELFVTVRARDRYDLDAVLHQLIYSAANISRVELDICLNLEKLVSGYGSLDVGFSTDVYSETGRANDEKIVSLLFNDGRMSNSEIARRLDITESAVRQRIKKMSENKLMRVGVVCNPISLGLGALAVARISAAPSKIDALVSRLCKLDSTDLVARVAGSFNVLTIFHGKDLSDLVEVCDANLGVGSHINEMCVSPLVASAKHRFDYTLIE